MAGMTKRDRVKRKLEKMRELAVAAVEVAETIEGSSLRRSDEFDVAREALDGVDRALESWERMEERRRSAEEMRAAEARRLEEFGPCEKCGTGVPADHEHCGECGWAMSQGECWNPACAVPGDKMSVTTRRSDGEEA